MVDVTINRNKYFSTKNTYNYKTSHDPRSITDLKCKIKNTKISARIYSDLSGFSSISIVSVTDRVQPSEFLQ